MNYKIMIDVAIAKPLALFDRTEKLLVLKTLDMMESTGQLGEPLFKDMNIWKYRAENLRFIYQKTSGGINIIKILKGSNPTIS